MAGESCAQAPIGGIAIRHPSLLVGAEPDDNFRTMVTERCDESIVFESYFHGRQRSNLEVTLDRLHPLDSRDLHKPDELPRRRQVSE